MWFQKISILPPQKGLEIPGRRGVSKTQKFKGMYEAKLEFPEGWGVRGQIPSVGGYGYFLEPNITKNMERFASNYYEYFPASTLLNAGITGDTVDAILTILYKVEGMDIPCKVKHIFLLCGTNNLPSTPLQLFHEPLLKFYFPFTQCPFAVIHLLPILPCFDQFRPHVSPTNSSTYFQIIVQILLCMDSIKDSIKTIREKEE